MSAFLGVHAIVTKHFCVHAHAVKRSTRFSTLEANELDMFELARSCEDHFRIDIVDAEMETLTSVGDLAALVNRKLAQDEEAA